MKNSKVLEVMYTEDSEVYYDFFTKDEYKRIIKEFFIEGGYKLPKSIKNKTLGRLTQKDYTKLFELLGYNVLGFHNYDPTRHVTNISYNGGTASAEA